MTTDTPHRTDSDVTKQQWLHVKIEAELARQRISQFGICSYHSFFQLVLHCDDDGCYAHVDESKMVSLGSWEELYCTLFLAWPPYFTAQDAEEFYA